MSRREKLTRAIEAQENLRGTVDDTIIEATISALRRELQQLEITGPEQRKLVTVLFMDTVGSTELIRDLDPEDDLALMDTAMRRLSDPVTRYGGRVTRYMGDGFKAVFGMPEAHENDPVLAVRAGLEILAAAAEYAREVEQKWGSRGFNVRVGINSGLVVAGRGSEGPDTITGTTVNLAARLESNAEPGTLLISQHTYQQVRGLFDLEPREPIHAKGFPEPVPVYRVLREKERTFRSRRRGVEGIDTRMIGRERELQVLQNAYHAMAETRQLQIVTVVGDAGLGKSRLLYEFENWVDLQPLDVLLYRGRARTETQHLPYGLMRDMFAFRFGIKADDAAESVRNKLLSEFTEMLGAGESAEMKAHFVGHLLGYNFRDSAYLEPVLDDPQQIQNRSLIYLSEYFNAASSRDPVLVLLEDLHWAGDSSLEAISRSGTALGEQPVLVVATARPELFQRRPHWFEGRAYHRRLDLHPLSEQDSQYLLSEVLQKVNEVPEVVRKLILSHAEGNPFYLEELVKMLIEEGVFIKGEQRWHVQADRLPGVHVPSTVNGVLQARLDRLPDDERTVLQQAAVIGRVFWDETIVHLNRSQDGQDGDHSVRPRIAALQERELVYRRDVSAFAEAAEFIFKHAILREVTYESVLKRLRLIYHAQVAQWLIDHSADRAGEVTGLIAGHLERAGDAEQAAAYLRQAGKQAAARFANDEAVSYYNRALALTPAVHHVERLSLLLAREEVHETLGDRDAQASDLAECERLAVALDEAERLPAQVEIALRRARYEEAVSDFPAAVAAASMTVGLAQMAGMTREEAAGYLHWGRSLWKQGDYQAARIRLERALTLARSAEARAEEAGSLLNLGNLYAFQGDFAQAQAHYLEALPLYRKSGHRNGESSVLGNLGNTYGYLGRTDLALTYYEQALAIAREIGDRHNEGTWLGNLAIDYKSVGQIERALTYIQQALAIARQIGDRRNEVIWLNTLGSAYHTLGQLDEADDCHRSALSTARQIGDRRGESRALTNLGNLSFVQRDFDEAHDYLQHALAIEHEMGDREGAAFALTGMGYVWLGSGRADEAAAAFQQALDLQEALGLQSVAMESRAGLASASLVKGEYERAYAHIAIILDFLTDHSLDGTEDPFRIYMACYRVLLVNQDERATDILNTAHNSLQTWAAEISDEGSRRSFLEKVTSHREILAEFAKTREGLTGGSSLKESASQEPAS